MTIRIAKTRSNFQREPLRAPFGFKGRTVSELWQAVARMDDDAGRTAVGLGTQSVLWSDAAVFERMGEDKGNEFMFQLTSHALHLCDGRSFEHPYDLLRELVPLVIAHGEKTLGGALRPTFALNALVAVDNAAWQLYALHHGITTFDGLVPEESRACLSERHAIVGNIPLISFGSSVDDAVAAARAGHSVLKIKIGSDPGKNGDQEQMLDWDCARISALHAALRDFTTSDTSDGGIAYYLDANGRYDSLERVKRLLDHCARIGALERVLLLEEPLPEESEDDVSGLPVCVAADESAHSVEDVIRRIATGYTAIALKPIAKTLSLSLQMAAEAERRGIACFCADLTVNPILIDWNKNVAARLRPLPGLKTGVFESNGAQIYRDWPRLRGYHPCAAASWIDPVGGHFTLDETFYEESGGIFKPSDHYAGLVTHSHAL